MAAEVQAPQDVIIERWLGYPKQKRNVIHKRAQSQVNAQPAPRNVIIDWETNGRVERVNQNMKFLGVETADPGEYERRFGHELVDSHRLPSDIVNKLEVPQGKFLFTQKSLIPNIIGAYFYYFKVKFSLRIMLT